MGGSGGSETLHLSGHSSSLCYERTTSHSTKYGSSFSSNFLFINRLHQKLILILTEDADGVGLDLGIGDLLVDGVTLDVDVPVPGADLEGDVGHRPPAALLRLKPPGVVSLRIEE